MLPLAKLLPDFTERTTTRAEIFKEAEGTWVSNSVGFAYLAPLGRLESLRPAYLSFAEAAVHVNIMLL